MGTAKRNHTAGIAVIGSFMLALILIAGMVWMGQSARKDTEDAVRSVSLLYLDELAGGVNRSWKTVWTTRCRRSASPSSC